MDTQTLVLGALIAFAAASTYSVTGFGFALVATPLLAATWEVKPAVPVSVLLSTSALVPLLFQVRGHVPIGRVSWLAAGSLTGVPLGIFLLGALDASVLQVLISATVIIASLLLYFAPRIGGERDLPLGRLASGFTSGALGASTSMGGPPVVLYLLSREKDVHRFRATLMAYFLPGNLMSITGFLIVGRLTEDVLTMYAAALPAVACGLVAGNWVRDHIHPERFRAVVVGLLVATALGVLASAALGAI